MADYVSRYTGAEIDSRLGAVTDKVDKVTGKGLSTNDYTTEEKNALAGLRSKESSWDGKYSKPASGIPSTDLASGVQSDLALAHSALQSVPDSYRSSADQDAIDAGKVDKETGKGLSENDYTDAEKAAVATIGDKADKVANPIDGNLVSMDSGGNLTDSETGLDSTKKYCRQNGAWVEAPTGGGGGTSDFDDLSNRPKYNGTAMTHSTNIPEVKTSAWDGKYDKPANGIPSTDLASAVQTSLGKADTALQSVPNTYRTASDQDTIDATKQGKASVATSIPASGLLPNVRYNVDWTSGGSKTVALQAGASGEVNEYQLVFSCGATAPSVTWSISNIKWAGGSAPTLNANKTYEINIADDGVSILAIACEY